MSTLNRVFHNNGLFIVFNFILFLLFYGVYVESGTRFFTSIAIYYLTFIISYLLIYRLIKDHLLKIQFSITLKTNRINIKYVLYFLIVYLIFVIITHYIDIGFFPVVKAYLSTDYYEIVDIRKEATRLSSLSTRYLSSFLLKAIGPFLLLYLLHKKNNKLYFLIYVIMVLYAISLMQKSYIVTLVTPSLIYSIYHKKYLYILKHILVTILYIYALLYITNPMLRNIEKPKMPNIELQEQKIVDNNKRNKTFICSIYKRAVLTPGKIVAQWFINIPENKPFLNGCGYRLIAPILGCEHVNYGQELYEDIFPNYAARGIKGNVNVAYFMYDYANFGRIGLIIAGIIMAFLLCILDLLFSFNILYKFAINGFYILMISSSALTTLLFSGGWGLFILLFIIFKNDLIKNSN